MLGELNRPVKYEGKITDGTLIVLGCSGPSLCGRDLIRDMNARGAPVFSLSGSLPQASVQPTMVSSDDQSLELLLEEFTDLFEPGLGTVKGPPVSLHVRSDAQPKFARARPVPYAQRDKVSDELNRLVAKGVLSAVPHSDWAAPIVLVVKRNGAL